MGLIKFSERIRIESIRDCRRGQVQSVAHGQRVRLEVRPNVKIVGGPFRDPFKNRRRRIPAVIAVARLIEDHRDAELRIVRRKKSDKRGKIFPLEVTAIPGLLSGAGFAGRDVIVEPGLHSGAIGRNCRFEGRHHLMGGGGGNDLADQVRPIFGDEVLLPGDHTDAA